jgi:hypothetical protein
MFCCPQVLQEGEAQHVREPAAAELGRAGRAGPAAGDELAVGIGETGRGGDRSVRVPGASVPVPDLVERMEGLLAERGDLAEYVADELPGQLAEGLQMRMLLNVQDVEQDEGGLVDRGVVTGH